MEKVEAAVSVLWLGWWIDWTCRRRPPDPTSTLVPSLDTGYDWFNQSMVGQSTPNPNIEKFVNDLASMAHDVVVAFT